MKFIPGTGLTRVLVGQELEEARLLLRRLQRSGVVRRREREAERTVDVNETVVNDNNENLLPENRNTDVMTPAIVIDSMDLWSDEPVR